MNKRLEEIKKILEDRMEDCSECGNRASAHDVDYLMNRVEKLEGALDKVQKFNPDIKLAFEEGATDQERHIACLVSHISRTAALAEQALAEDSE